MSANTANLDHITEPPWDSLSDFVSLSDSVASTAEPNRTTVYDIPKLVISSALLLIIIVAVIFGNILVLLAVCIERKLRTVTNYFIFNLAVADLFLGTLVLPFSGTLEVIGYWPFGQKFCDVWAAVDVLCCTASIISLCVISIDRYIGVTRPLKHKLIVTPKRALIIIVIVWLLSFAIAVGPLFGWRPIKDDPLVCPLSDSIDYVFFSVSGSFYIPLIVIIVLYVRIYQTVSGEYKSRHSEKCRGSPTGGSAKNSPNGIVLRMHRGSVQTPAGHQLVRRQNSANNLRPSRTASQRSVTFNREKKVAKTLGIVVSVFFLCWFPFFFLLPLTSACQSCYVPPLAFDIFFWLGYCNSFMNPLIYAVSNMTFRRAFKKLLSCQYCQECPWKSSNAPRKVYNANSRGRLRTDSQGAASTACEYDTRGRDDLLEVVMARCGPSTSENFGACSSRDETQELLPPSGARRTLSDGSRVDGKVLYARLSMGDTSLSTITEVQEHTDGIEMLDNSQQLNQFSSPRVSISDDESSVESSVSHSPKLCRERQDYFNDEYSLSGNHNNNLLITSAVINHTGTEYSNETDKRDICDNEFSDFQLPVFEVDDNVHSLSMLRPTADDNIGHLHPSVQLMSIETSL